MLPVKLQQKVLVPEYVDNGGEEGRPHADCPAPSVKMWYFLSKKKKMFSVYDVLKTTENSTDLFKPTSTAWVH